jgi:hypothetical protein
MGQVLALIRCRLLVYAVVRGTLEMMQVEHAYFALDLRMVFFLLVLGHCYVPCSLANTTLLRSLSKFSRSRHIVIKLLNHVLLLAKIQFLR